MSFITFLKDFIVTYLIGVGTIWGFMEVCTYFKGDYLKNTLGPYWILIYGIPAIIAIVVAGMRTTIYNATIKRKIIPKRFRKTPPAITKKILNRELYIYDKIKNFVGRDFVFDAIEQFISNNPRGYFIIKGEPGIGKSALAAQLINTHNYIHHFNIRAEGTNKAENFLTNVCAQLIAKYHLNYDILPAEASKDGNFFLQLLEDVAKKQKDTEEKIIIVVDALDEVDTTSLDIGVNLLYLPTILPSGVYIIATMRPNPNLTLQIRCEQMNFEITQDSKQNIADIREYLKKTLKRLGIIKYIESQKIDDQQFIDRMADKSQGNFMYLHYIIPEIEKGAYSDTSLDKIPVGLENYYEDHWQRMRGRGEEAWFKYKLPLITALTVVKEPVSIDLIADFSKVTDLARIRSLLQEWEQFLYVTKESTNGKIQKRYRMYHVSFHDFLAKKVDIKDERVDLKAMHEQIADCLENEWKLIKSKKANREKKNE